MLDRTRSRRNEIPKESGPEMMPDENTRFKREYGSVLSSSQDGFVSQYYTSERLTLVIPHNDSDIFRTTEHFITIFAQINSTFFFEYMQEAPKLNFSTFFGLFFSSITFTLSFTVAVFKLIRVFVDQRQAMLNRRLRERRAYRPIASIMLYLHSGKEVTFSQDQKKLDVAGSEDEEHPKLSMGSITTTKKEKHKNIRGGSKQDSKKKLLDVLDTSNIAIWPVTMQTTADETASVYSLIVQLPSRKSPTHMLCAGSSLVHHTEPSGVDQPSSGTVLRRRLKNRGSAAIALSPVPEESSSTAEVTTQL